MNLEQVPNSTSLHTALAGLDLHVATTNYSFDDDGHIFKAATVRSGTSDMLSFRLEALLPRRSAQGVRRGTNDVRFTQAALTPSSDDAAQRLNIARILGLTTWQNGESIDVSPHARGFGLSSWLTELCSLRPDVVACARLADRRGKSSLRLLVS